MPTPIRPRRCAIGLVLLLAAAAAPAQEEPAEQANVEAALALTRDCATRYEMTTDASDRALALHPRPILRWSNPERGQIYGNVFLWTHGGRPQAVGSLFKWYSPFTHMSHEFHSLSTSPLAARYEGREVWRTTEPGVAYSPLPDAPPVADVPGGRLIQMRQLARKFSAREVDREGNKIELRLLPQPVYRYENPASQSDFVDGGLFVFVQGTDPELWLLLEAHRGAADNAAQWMYAAARMNSVDLSLDYDRQTVWHRDVLPWSDISSHKETYTSFGFKESPP